ncbi:mannose-1-phosphate guanylyltransferase/mannose-6-phosphate isomerase [Gammaproteobacteria bacterium]|nr:mannose-1-phosphate guanylyltransferase/mannose-6-phosphate isomerase [Gammaproteobacteria bacterium]
MNICAVVMAGGSGTRLWPVSRAKRPKQFLNLYDNETMLQSTFKRLTNLDIDSFITICNNDHRFFVAEQLKEIDLKSKIILEPVGRNTAPAIALSALCSDEDTLLLVLSADHLIKNKENFTQAVNQAIPIAEDGKLVVFGVTPDNPNTGYGYIKKGENYKDGFIVDSFREKPTLKKAKDYLSSEEYFWNSGMFLFKASVFLDELNKYRPDIYQICKSATKSLIDDLDFTRIDEKIFNECPSESVDFAVMENTSEAVMVKMDAEWNDIGSWSSLWDVSNKDSNSNVISGDVIMHDVSNSYIRADNSVVAAVGVDDLIIIVSQEVVLVAKKNKSQDISTIVHKLKNDQRPEWEIHREVHRPWGKFDSIDQGERYQVKRITVKPRAKLSLQKHKYRAEHWIVVSGVAKVTKGDNSFVLSENESTYIPLGEVHALENPGDTDLELIEVQSGSYLGEDDIVRLEDIYGRS